MPKIYDMHIHSIYSKDSNLKPEIILKTAKKRGLNGIAVTDHNTIKGGIITSKLNKDRDFEVIVGSEIRTNHCEVLGYYLQEEIKSKDFLEVLDKIREQGGISIIAHPFAFQLRYSLNYPLEKIKTKVNGLEGFNGRAIFQYENKKAYNAAEKYNLGMTGSSDAHFSFEIGKGFTLFNSDLRTAIIKRKTKVDGSILYSKFGKLCTAGYLLSRLFH